MSSEQLVNVYMPVYCFDVIIEYLNSKQVKECPSSIPPEKIPIFVTWNKEHNHSLRGCIGTFSKTSSLRSSLSEYAITSAFRDSRFPPITLDEVPSLTCTVSLLLKFEKAKHYMDWEIGVHGIYISLIQNEKRLKAVFLPEVPLEKKWNYNETIDNLMRKAGFIGHISDSDRSAVSVERFQSERVTISFKEFCNLKKEQGEIISLEMFKKSN